MAGASRGAGNLTVFEFTEEVDVFGINFLRTFRLAFSSRPAFSDEWFRPFGGGRARMLSIRRVCSTDIQGWLDMRSAEIPGQEGG